GESYSAGKLISFSAPLILASIAQAFLTDLDLMFVKGLVTEDTAAGHYTAAKALAYAAPFTFFALSSALYPAVSRAYSSGNEAGLKDYIHKANLMLAALILPAVVLVWSNSGDLIQMLYGEEYADAGPALSWLAIGFSFLAVFIIHKTIITACGFPKISSVMTVGLLPLSVIAQFTMIPYFGLKGAAMAAAVTFLTGVISSSLVLILKFRAMIQPVVLLRILIAAVVVYFADSIGSHFGVPMIPKVICALLLYLAVLRLLGGWYLRDIKEFLTLMSPGRQG
ncbi:oligosaccharide flippase family protein, partial [bacterium]|nr:oligosaccharide flippase family protein [bacterium]